MGHLFEYLGLTTGCIQNSQHGEIRRAQYECDITYGTASEFGFDLPARQRHGHLG